MDFVSEEIQRQRRMIAAQKAANDAARRQVSQTRELIERTRDLLVRFSGATDSCATVAEARHSRQADPGANPVQAETFERDDLL